MIAIIVALARLGTLRERQAARWLGLGLLWTAFALTFISPSLATVIPGLPNDHYHAFADPMVFTLVGLGAGALWRVRPGRAAGRAQHGREPDAAPADERTVPLGPAVVVATLAVLVAWNLVNQPPAVHPDGGFPAAEAAGARILAATGAGTTITLRSLPDFKSTEAYAYPLIRAGAIGPGGHRQRPRRKLGRRTGRHLRLAVRRSDRGALRRPSRSHRRPRERFGDPVDRFLAAPGRTISIYRGALASTPRPTKRARPGARSPAGARPGRSR